MELQDKALSEKESLSLIAQMIGKAKDSYHATGTGAMMWGAVITVCSLVKLSEIHFGYSLPFDIFLLTFVAIIPQILINRQEKRKRIVKSFDDVYMKYIWRGFGISIFLLIFFLNVIHNAWNPAAVEFKELTGKNSSFQFSEYISSLFLLLYGIPTFITGGACRFRPMLWGGIICWVCCLAALFTPVEIDLLLTALSAITAWFIPGLIMEREYRKYKTQQLAADV